ncbi:Ribonuclease Z [Lentibacillus sp. JNUCC-1]|uniref:MBL fold metallo-hydrolase n=1 Tax=Lentibacillus sp. JNUCC-1 TaxID=2654513 RepID=UPI0012E6FF9B|nr:MBL fold metallo-hydrolase [Lentibacillus sp. JNUCC-1]MUV36572.1 Ribonuclease Z [Lentibacillus sp. JNUCC-1]
MKWTVVGFWGGYPAPGSATSAYLLEKDGFTLLVDAGSGALSRLQTIKPLSELDAVILSHYHHDHVADIGVLQYAQLVRSFIEDGVKVLPIYGHQEDSTGFDALTHRMTKGVPYFPEEELVIGPFRITFLKTKHPVPCYGMRITDGDQTIVYTADTAYQDTWIDFARNADLLVVDCNFYAHQSGGDAGHMTSAEGGRLAQAAGAKELLLSHLPQYGLRQQLVEEATEHFTGKIHLAHENFTW